LEFGANFLARKKNRGENLVSTTSGVKTIARKIESPPLLSLQRLRMTLETFPFDDLPAELKQHVALFLDPLAFVNLGLTSKRNMVDVLGILDVTDLTEPQFDMHRIEEKQLASKGKHNHRIHNAFAKAISARAAWPAVVLGNILWKTRNGLDMHNAMDGIIKAKAWRLFFRFCNEEFFVQHTFSSKTLERITDYSVFVYILSHYRIKWMRGWREACLCEWATDQQLYAILTHPNYEPTLIIQREFDLKRKFEFEEAIVPRKRQKKLDKTPNVRQPIEVIDLTGW